MIRLGVNIDHVATLRQVRQATYPSVVDAAILAVKGGAEQITVHLREDRRHIQPYDVTDLLKLLKQKKMRRILLNLEMAVTPTMVRFATKHKPQWVCLVPEKRQEVTTEGGLDVAGAYARCAKATAQLQRAGILVSPFIDADEHQVRACAKMGANAIEFHTGEYANARSSTARKKLALKIARMSQLAHTLGLEVHAGHGLTLENVAPIAAIPEMVELNIGHFIVGHAVSVGLERAVRAMKQKMLRAHRSS